MGDVARPTFRALYTQYQTIMSNTDKALADFERILDANAQARFDHLKLRHITPFMNAISSFSDYVDSVDDLRRKFGILKRLGESVDADDGFPYNIDLVQRASEPFFEEPSVDPMHHLGYQIVSIRGELAMLSDAIQTYEDIPHDHLKTIAFHMCAALRLALDLSSSDHVVDDSMLGNVGPPLKFNDLSYPFSYYLFNPDEPTFNSDDESLPDAPFSATADSTKAADAAKHGAFRNLTSLAFQNRAFGGSSASRAPVKAGKGAAGRPPVSSQAPAKAGKGAAGRPPVSWRPHASDTAASSTGASASDTAASSTGASACDTAAPASDTAAPSKRARADS